MLDWIRHLPAAGWLVYREGGRWRFFTPSRLTYLRALVRLGQDWTRTNIL